MPKWNGYLFFCFFFFNEPTIFPILLLIFFCLKIYIHGYYFYSFYFTSLPRPSYLNACHFNPSRLSVTRLRLRAPLLLRRRKCAASKKRSRQAKGRRRVYWPKKHRSRRDRLSTCTPSHPPPMHWPTLRHSSFTSTSLSFIFPSFLFFSFFFLSFPSFPSFLFLSYQLSFLQFFVPSFCLSFNSFSSYIAPWPVFCSFAVSIVRPLLSC